MRGLFFSAAFLAIVISVAIVVSLAGGAIDFLSKVELDKLWSRGWFPRRNLFDIKTIFVGTLLISAIAMLVAAPIGLGVALYLSEYASRRSRRFPEADPRDAGVGPERRHGLLRAAVHQPRGDPAVLRDRRADLQRRGGRAWRSGLLVTPLVASVAEDAMHAVPGSLREASVGLGARRRTTSIRVVMPAAVSGITAALILGLSRAIGETMIVAIVAGGTGGSLFSVDPLKGGQTMTAAITSLATGSDQVRGAGPAYPSLFFVGLLLFLLTLALNLGAERFVRRVRRQY